LFRLLAFIQQAASWITRKLLRQPGNRFPSALPHASGTLRRKFFQVRKSLPEPDSVELIYGEYSDAALRATGTTDEPLAASAHGVGQLCIHDLNQRLISRRWRRRVHAKRIPQQSVFLIECVGP
jgi:hypothetical protein